MSEAASSDPDVIALLDRAVQILVEHLEYRASDAESLVREFYLRFQDPLYCHSINVPLWNDDDFFHQEGGGIALRAHYHLTLKGEADYGSFRAWAAEWARLRNSKP